MTRNKNRRAKAQQKASKKRKGNGGIQSNVFINGDPDGIYSRHPYSRQPSYNGENALQHFRRTRKALAPPPQQRPQISLKKLRQSMRAACQTKDVTSALQFARKLVDASDGSEPEGDAMKDLLCLLVSHSCVADATALLIAQRVRLGLPAAVEDSCDPAASSGWGRLWGASAAANAANAANDGHCYCYGGLPHFGKVARHVCHQPERHRLRPRSMESRHRR